MLVRTAQNFPKLLKTTRWTENRSENYHFVLHRSHRIDIVSSFWGLVLPFLSKAWLNQGFIVFVVVDSAGWFRWIPFLQQHVVIWSQGFDLHCLDMLIYYIYSTTLREIRVCLKTKLDLLLFSSLDLGISEMLGPWLPGDIGPGSIGNLPIPCIHIVPYTVLP